MRTESVPQERTFGLRADELAHWNENGYLVRLNVFTAVDSWQNLPRQSSRSRTRYFASF